MSFNQNAVGEFQPDPNFLITQFTRLADALTERRSDISDEIYEILRGKQFSEDNLEGRYIIGTLPNQKGRVFYDTLTTLMEYYDDEKSDCHWLDMAYSDDTFECSVCNENTIKRKEMADGYQVCLTCQQSQEQKSI